MSIEVSKIVQAAVASGEKRRQRRSTPEARSPAAAPGKGVLLSVPIVLVSTLALSLNLAAPAHAVSVQKKPLKSKTATAAPIVKDAAGLQVGVSAPAGVHAAQAAPAQYTVVDGDTISGIAGRFGVATASVLALNGLGWSATIFPGQVLTLTDQAAPAAPAPAPVSAPAGSHTVQTGDTIGAIAAAHGLSTDAVLGANGLDRSSVIFPGQAIVVPGAGPAALAAAPVSAVASTAPTGSEHTIASGDTIVSVADAAGVSVQAVLDANGLGWSSMIYPGQVLTIPGDPAAVATAAAATPVLAVNVVPLMTDEMRQNAATIVAVGRSAGVNDYGLVVALAAAAQESGLRNVDYGDRDSLGLFQQRPSSGWGTNEQTMDATRASLAFFGGTGNPNPGVTRGLLDIAGWESMTVTQAAQAVQISAFPDHYAKWEAAARTWLAELG